MALRSAGRKLSFEILSRNIADDEAAADGLFYRSNSDPVRSSLAADHVLLTRRNRKKKKKRIASSSIPESPAAPAAADVDDDVSVAVNGLDFSFSQTVLCHVDTEVFSEQQSSLLRQRSVKAVDETTPSSDGGLAADVIAKPNGMTAESLDWQRVMAEDSNYMFTVDKSPLKYFMEEMSNGNSLRSTTTLGNEKERERVYDTIFRLPWRCELLIDVGFFVCFDSFLSLLTIMPTRILMTLWRLVRTRRQFKRPSAADLSDFGCFTVMACGVILLEKTDISLIYHMIRGQGTIKLYVVYNVLEIFDKLCQSFNGDVLQNLFNSADGLACCPTENMRFWIWRFMCDQALAVTASIIHSFILLAQAITMSTCIVAHNNALLALLVSNNFSEIKGNVFKRYSKENIHSIVYFDSIERFHISAFLIFILAQNILEAEGPWFENYLFNAGLVFISEMMIDIVKHSFIAKFNDIKPIAYSEFLEDLCKQYTCFYIVGILNMYLWMKNFKFTALPLMTLNVQPESTKKNLTFIPIAPACVVIRVITPVYAAHLPHGPLPWRLFWILFLFAMTNVMLTSLKVLVGMGLQKHASWYVNRCRRKKHHLHYD